ncbi:MAG: replicative DNA helicase [Actinobacteria bacterium]|nr:replicative DNA helicase [Actinomycetota bacterium]
MAIDPTHAGGQIRAAAAGAPPHDLEAESSVLGAIMLAERWLDPLLIDVGLKPDDFYRQSHRLIYRAIIKLQEASEPIDTLTVSAQLTEDGELEEAGGREYVETLVERIPSLANTRQYGQIVKENSLLRNLLRASQEIQESIAVREGDPKELLERAQQRVFEVAQDNQSGDFRSIGDVMHDELEKLEKQSLEGAALTGTPSGFRDLDELTGGFQNGNLIIIAARPSMGKSALVTNIAENAALAGNPVALFSLEMSQTELAQRFVASQAKIDGDALRKGKVKKDRWPAVLRAAQELSEAPLWIDDSSDINILELRAKARRLHGKSLAKVGKGLGLVIVDYLQLLRANDSRESRVEQVSQMSRGLKVLARELNIPVIAVSQLSRAVESRHPPRPQLSDLRECVTGDTLVWLADGRRVPIADLVGRTPIVRSFEEGSQEFIDAECDMVWCVGTRATVIMETIDGRRLKATPDHTILTETGWRTVGSLVPGDRVCCSNSVPAELAILGDVLHPTDRFGIRQKPAWRAVATIEEGGVEEVYDLTVPGPANWIANGGIVTHNSGQIEQDADLVAFIYREDYYLRDESQRPGEADIIVSKHRNGPVRDVALTFISHYPKFSNLPRGYGSDQGGGSPDRVPAAPVPADDSDLDEF